MRYTLDTKRITELIRDRDSLNDRGLYKQEDGNIVIKNCEVSDELLIGNFNDNIYRIVIFEECKFMKDIKLHNSIGISKLQFKDCSFEKSIFVSYSTFELSIEGNCSIKENFKISSDNGNSIVFKDSVIDGNMFISGRFHKGIRIENINTNKKNGNSDLLLKLLATNLLTLKNVCFGKILLENRVEVDNEILFDDITANSIELNHMKIGLLFTLNSSHVDNITIDNIESNHRHIIMSNCILNGTVTIALSMIDKLNISDGSISTLRLWGNHNKESFLNLEKTTISNLKFDDVFNEGNISIRDIKISHGGCFSIKSSNLGKTDFILCDFAKAKFEFENSKLTELFLSETDFPKYVYTSGKINPSQGQLFFGQLHTAFQRQGDNVRAIEYQAREIASYYKTIKFFSKDLFKKINLFLNKISNNFGRYWTYGIIFSFSVGALFFYLLLISTNEYYFGFPVKFDFAILSAYLKFMNPLRFFELDSIFRINTTTNKITLGNWSHLWDFLGRVFVAYGFYQTIQAFRKFGKS